MTYPGDSNLSDDVRQRVEDTFKQSRQLALEGKQQEASLGCEFVLRLDPLFEPARELMDRLASGQPIEVVEGSPPSEPPMPDFTSQPSAGPGDDFTAQDSAGAEDAEDAFDLAAEFDDLLDRRDFRTLMNLAGEHTQTVQDSPELAAKVAEASDRLEAEPYMREFLDAAEKAQRQGRLNEANALVTKARALDPSHPGLPPEAPTDEIHESNDRIRELLEEGQASLERGDFQDAIDSWSRIFLIDIDHAEANQRIERARRMKAENERQIEQAFHEAVSLWERGTTDEARELFERVLELDASHAGARDYLDRMSSREAAVVVDTPEPASELGNEILSPPGPDAAAPPPPPGAINGDLAVDDLPLEDSAPVAVPKPAKSGFFQKKFLSIAAGGLFLLLALLAVAYFKKDVFFPNPEAEPQAVTVDILARARSLHESGQTAMAIAQLNRLPTDHPQYAEAQALVAQWEAPVEETEPEGPTEEQLAQRDALVAQAQQARQGREYLRALELFVNASESAPLSAEDELVQEEVRQRLAGLQPQIEMFEQGDWEFVLPELWKLHSADPADLDIVQLMVDSYYNLGVRDLQRGDAPAAAEKFLRASELKPTDAEVERLSRFSQIYGERRADMLYRIFVKYLPFR